MLLEKFSNIRDLFSECCSAENRFDATFLSLPSIRTTGSHSRLRVNEMLRAASHPRRTEWSRPYGLIRYAGFSVVIELN